MIPFDLAAALVLLPATAERYIGIVCDSDTEMP